MNTDLHFSTGNDEVETPDALFDMLHAQHRFVVDVAAIKTNAKVENYFGPDHEDPARRDCLTIDWPTAGACWMNPPYSKGEKACKAKCKKKVCPERGYHVQEDKPGCYDFVKKSYLEMHRGVTTVALLAARTDTNWFFEFIWDQHKQRPKRGVTVTFLRGRLKFKGQRESAPFPSMIVRFCPKNA